MDKKQSLLKPNTLHLSPRAAQLHINMRLAGILSFLVRLFERGMALKWAILGLAFLGCLLIGWWGFLDAGESGLTASEALYRSLQLFVLESGADAKGVKLEFARFFAVIVSIYAILLTLFQFFLDRIRAYLPRLWSNHVVIAGLGSTGLKLVESFWTGPDKIDVVVIEQDDLNANIRAAEAWGAIVLRGDASDPHLLGRACVSNAGQLLAVCREDETNLEIVAQASNIINGSDRFGRLGYLKAYIHFSDVDFYHLLFRHTLFTTHTDKLEIRIFNYYENAARHLFFEHPLDRKPVNRERRHVHLIVAGLGFMGEALVLQAAKTGHFAGGPGERLAITVIEKDEDLIRKKEGALKNLGIDRICDITFFPGDIESQAVQDNICEWTCRKGAISSVAICLGKTHAASFCALALSKRLSGDIPVFLHMTRKKGFASLFAKDGAETALGHAQVIPFGMPDAVSTPEAIMGLELDLLAKQVYRDYCGCKEAALDRLWEELAEWEKMSSRAQADHIEIKLRALNCYSAQTPHSPGDESIDEFTRAQVELAAKMEHRRWNAERFLNGWKPYRGEAPWDTLSKDEQARIKNALYQSPYLVDWEKLPENIKEYDRNAVRNIFNILGRIPRQVFQKR